MKHFVQYVDTSVEEGDRKVVRLFEMNDVKQEDKRGNSLAMLAAPEACKQAIIKMSLTFNELNFSWGHEEADGRTWLHGHARDGRYVDEVGRPHNTRKVEIQYVNGTSETLRSASDPFEFDLTNESWANVKSMMFIANGMEAGSIYLKKDEEPANNAIQVAQQKDAATKSFNVTSTIISMVALPCETVEEAIALIEEGGVDLIKDATDITNVTLDGGLEEEDVELAN